MQIIRYPLDLIFFRNPIIVLVLSFITLYLAFYLDDQINAGKTDSLQALKNGPPAITRVENYLTGKPDNSVKELNLLAEIDLSDNFTFTVLKAGKKITKYFIPLYAATKNSTENAAEIASARVLTHMNSNKRYDFNMRTGKRLVGAIVSDNENIMEETLKLSSGYGQIGPIIKVDGQKTSFSPNYVKQAQDALTILGITYGKYGMKPVYINAFFGNRDAILQGQISKNTRNNPIYFIAYMLLAIAYFRSLWSVIMKASGNTDPSLINAIIRRFGGNPESTKLVPITSQKKPALFKQDLPQPENIVALKQKKHRKPNLFGNTKRISKQSAKTVGVEANQVLGRRFNKI